mmetsp:Transcript_19009/g.53221  ORF Transcript_19009/g.53221 Transcript_19009/m.53221 type:complete len:378 (+) Transcript_19009:12-1145(+)
MSPSPKDTADEFSRAQASFVKLSSKDAGVNCGAALEDLSWKARQAAEASKAPSSCSYMASLPDQPIGPSNEESTDATQSTSKEALHPATHLPMSLYEDSRGSRSAPTATTSEAVASARKSSWWRWGWGGGRRSQSQEQSIHLQQQQQQQQEEEASISLNKSRSMSSIPMTGPLPHHQKDVYGNENPSFSSPSKPASEIQALAPQGSLPSPQSSSEDAQSQDPVWVYPSEEMFFNAMKRKGWNPQAPDMPMVVAIHNSVNERAWSEVMAWESRHKQACPTGPKLKRFLGKPNELSPKARILNFLGFAPPFDRHDWVVDRCGQEVRYVIDFYAGVPRPGGPPAAMFLDVRPALDSVSAAWDRLTMQASWITSGKWLSSS